MLVPTMVILRKVTITMIIVRGMGRKTHLQWHCLVLEVAPHDTLWLFAFLTDF